jgi:hypothetical protein
MRGQGRGAPAMGLEAGFALGLDGEAVSPPFLEVASGSHTATLSLEGLEEGYHRLSLSCEDESRASNEAHLRFLHRRLVSSVFLPARDRAQVLDHRKKASSSPEGRQGHSLVAGRLVIAGSNLSSCGRGAGRQDCT